jgi:hypothetical protein
MLTLSCSRPHIRTVDFRIERFVVAKVCGLDVDGRHLERGDEVPAGALSEMALRQVYDTPLRRIETVEYAFTQDEALRTECLARGVPPPDSPEQEPPEAVKTEEPPRAVVIAPDLDSLPYGDLVELCKENGVNSNGNKHQLKKRLSALLG